MSKQPLFAREAALPWRAELFVDESEQEFMPEFDGDTLPPEEPEWWLVDASGNYFQPIENFAGDESPEAMEARSLLFAVAPELLEALTEKLPCTLSNTSFADDLETIADAVELAGYNVTAADLCKKAQRIRHVINKATGRLTGIPVIDEALAKRPLSEAELRAWLQLDEQPLSDPMHQLAATPLYDPSRDKTTPLADLMRQKHAAGECGMLLCPECKEEEEGVNG